MVRNSESSAVPVLLYEKKNARLSRWRMKEIGKLYLKGDSNQRKVLFRKRLFVESGSSVRHVRFAVQVLAPEIITSPGYSDSSSHRGHDNFFVFLPLPFLSAMPPIHFIATKSPAVPDCACVHLSCCRPILTCGVPKIMLRSLPRWSFKFILALNHRPVQAKNV